MGLRNRHEHGAANASKVLSADLSGPHPEAKGTKIMYMLVDVSHGGEKTKHLPFARGQE